MKSFGVVLGVAVLGVAGLIAAFMASLSRNAEFYVPIVLVITVGGIVCIFLIGLGRWKKRAVKVGALIFFALCAALIIGHEGYQKYLKSLEVVSNQDVDLSEYRPFSKDTKAVSLEEEPAYKIKDNLPMLDGATALYPVYSSFVQAVYPKKNYPLEEGPVVSSQTNNAFERVVSGDADIAFMA